MATTVPKKFGKGGVGLAPGHGTPDLVTIINLLIDELNVLRTSFTTLTAKLDAEDVLNLDTDYGTVCDPAAITIEKAT